MDLMARDVAAASRSGAAQAASALAAGQAIQVSTLHNPRVCTSHVALKHGAQLPTGAVASLSCSRCAKAIAWIRCGQAAIGRARWARTLCRLPF